MLALIVAYTKNRVIGNAGCIPWRIKGEQRRFRELTIGNVVVMGRRSYEEIDAKIEGDTFFPEFDESEFVKEVNEHVDGDIPYTYVTYTRK